MSEKQQLQQKLKLDRTQWQKLLQLQQQQQEASTAQLHNLLTSHAADITAMKLDSQQEEDLFNAEYTKYAAPSSPPGIFYKDQGGKHIELERM